MKTAVIQTRTDDRPGIALEVADFLKHYQTEALQSFGTECFGMYYTVDVFKAPPESIAEIEQNRLSYFSSLGSQCRLDDLDGRTAHEYMVAMPSAEDRDAVLEKILRLSGNIRSHVLTRQPPSGFTGYREFHLQLVVEGFDQRAEEQFKLELLQDIFFDLVSCDRFDLTAVQPPHRIIPIALSRWNHAG